MKYTHIVNDNSQTVVAVIDGELYTATNEHPMFNSILLKVKDGTATASDFDFKQNVIEYMSLAPEVEIVDDVLMLAGTPAHDALAKKIVDSVRNGESATPLVNFISKLLDNPSRNSRDQLFDWLEASGFEINDDGDIVGYKSVYSSGLGDYYLSVSSGTAFVNGAKQVGQITQYDGSEVSMPRYEVTDNPAIACSYGLHVGTIGYADSFSGDTIIKVIVNPADVVSVPNDDARKMRVCRYTVVGVHIPEPEVDVVEQHTFVNSSFLDVAYWNPSTSQLKVVFIDDSVHEYENVDAGTWAEFTNSDTPDSSPGSYFNEWIKNW